jgi:hypothetical protein
MSNLLLHSFCIHLKSHYVLKHEGHCSNYLMMQEQDKLEPTINSEVYLCHRSRCKKQQHEKIFWSHTSG